MKLLMQNITIWLSFFAIFLNPLFGNQTISIKLEIERALGKGVKWLNDEQNATSGSWGEPDYPALTGLALRATMGYPDQSFTKKYASNQRRVLIFCFPKYNRMEVSMEKAWQVIILPFA